MEEGLGKKLSLLDQLVTSQLDVLPDLVSPEKVKSNTKLELENDLDQPFIKKDPIE